MKTRRYTDLQLADAVKESHSIRQVMTKIGLVEAGGNYISVSRRIENLGLDTSHFRGRGWRKGAVKPPRHARPLQEILTVNSPYRSSLLRERLLAENLKSHRCDHCCATEWMGKPIPLELHHSNGNPRDNRFENLQLLCPNCHALTESYRGKAIKKV